VLFGPGVKAAIPAKKSNAINRSIVMTFRITTQKQMQKMLLMKRAHGTHDTTPLVEHMK
jgi:hypothetical protein